MKEKLITFLLIFSLTVNIAALCTIGYFWGKNYRDTESIIRRGGPPPEERLALNRGQQGRMQELRELFLKEIDPIRGELVTKREELLTLLSSEDPDRDAINQKLAQINQLQAKTEHAAVDYLIKEKTFLTPWQQKQYFDLINERCCCRPPFHRGRGPGGGMGMGEGKGRKSNLPPD
jgi:hypothetical protein